MDGDGVVTVVRCMEMGWGWKKFIGDGAEMGLIFTTVSLFKPYRRYYYLRVVFH